MGNLERNMKLLQVLSCAAPEDSSEKKEVVKTKVPKLKKEPKMKKKVKEPLTEAELQLLEIDREIRREAIKEEKRKRMEEKIQKKREEQEGKRKEREEREEEKRKEREERLLKRGALRCLQTVEKEYIPRPQRIVEKKDRPQRIIEGKENQDPSLVDDDEFMCKFCHIFPREESKNKSELYRHYSLVHYSKEIKEKYLQMDLPGPCPECPPDSKDLQRASSVSHMGQKHCKVRMMIYDFWNTVPIIKIVISTLG